MRTLMFVVGLLVLAAQATAEPSVKIEARNGYVWHQAALVIDEATSIPLYLSLPRDRGGGAAYIHNAEEEIEVDAAWNGDALTLTFPHYDSEATLREGPGGGLAGEWTRVRADGPVAMPMRAFPLEEPPGLYSGDADGHDEARYAMSLEKSGPALGVFQIHRTPGVRGVTGTILTPTGDYRYLAGARFLGRDAERLGLSVFDGAHAFLFTAEVNPDTGDLVNGRFYSGAHWRETFTARRLEESEEFELPDPFSEVSLKPGVTRLGLPKLSEPPYAGNPTIVQIMGTWCPNCHDEAPALVGFYEEYHEEGLQILSLCYEYTDDAERSRRQIERFKERHGATWEFVAAGTSDKSKAAATLPALSAIKSYPTTIWINPDGTARAIHSGFSGPATGERHTETLAEFERLTREIVGAQED